MLSTSPSEILSSPRLSVVALSSFSPIVSFPTLRVKRLNFEGAPHSRLAHHSCESPYVPLGKKMKLLLDSRVNKEKQVNLNERGVICLVNTHKVHFVLGVIFISVQSPLIWGSHLVLCVLTKHMSAFYGDITDQVI